MSKRNRPSGRTARPRGPRKLAPLAERIARLARLERGLSDHYPTERVTINHIFQVFVWRVRVCVPVYDDEYTLRIELEEGWPVRVTAEGWTGQMKHTYGSNRLCMWHPDDPPDRRWNREDGLLKLVDTAVAHLFKELYHRETGEWLGEEAPHGAPKIEPRMFSARLAA